MTACYGIQEVGGAGRARARSAQTNRIDPDLGRFWGRRYFRKKQAEMVELSGIEPLTSSLRRAPGEFPQNSTAFFNDYKSMI